MNAIYVLIAIPLMTSLLVASFAWYRYYFDEETVRRRKMRQWNSYRRRRKTIIDAWYRRR